MRDKVMHKIKSRSFLMQSLVNSSMYLMKSSGCVGLNQKNLSFDLGKMVTNKILSEMGFDCVTGAMIGGAPVSEHLSQYMIGLGINICESYGLSEVFGPITGNLPEEHVNGSVGKPFKGSDLKLVPLLDYENEFEICIDSPTLFMGYLNDPTKTAQSFNKELYFKTGDLGKITSTGHVFITGRYKELIITAGGENIAPIPIEERLVKKLPFISNAMVVGDQKPFLSVLFTLKTKLDLTTNEPTDELLDECIQILKSYGISGYKSAQELISSAPERLANAIDTAMKSVNSAAVNNASRVNKYLFVPQDFSISGGELGPTMKMKRSAIAEKYKGVIDNLYEKAAIEIKATKISTS